MKITAISIGVLAIVAGLLLLFNITNKAQVEHEQTLTGFIRDARQEQGKNVLAVDDIEFLSGESAILAGIEDTGCARESISDCIPSLNNDFYIRNLSTSTMLYTLDTDADIEIMRNPGSPELTKVSSQEFVDVFSDAALLLNQMPFQLKARGEIIESLIEQYTP